MKKEGAGKIGEILDQRPRPIRAKLRQNPTTKDSDVEIQIISL